MKLGSQEELPADFGKYVLTRLIATGGMAEIFLAYEKTRPDDAFVIKRILPHLIESSEFVSMFLDEARIAAQLHHENIVEIFDVGRIEGAYFIAMEYIHGEDIRRIYNQAYKLQRSLPLSHSIRIIAEAAVGLGFAHRLPGLTGKPLGVVHRDVSPQNILVTYDGSVKIVDFGIAKAASKVSQTRAGVLKGKYSYMSPEQATGDPLDHRTDIFALGIILYETTTGTRLFKRQNELATLQAIMRCDFKRPSAVLQGYPLELENILMKALAMDVSDRYQEAEDFSRDLFQFLRNSGLHVEHTDISQFMHELFEPDSAPKGTLEIRRDRKPKGQKRNVTALERKATKTEIQGPPSSLSVEEVSEQDAVQRNPTVTRAEHDDIVSDDPDKTEAINEGSLESVLQVPGFVDAGGLSMSGDTVAESFAQAIDDKAKIQQASFLNEIKNPVAEQAYQAQGPAKDELATVAVARAYRPPREQTPVKPQAHPKSRDQQQPPKGLSLKILIGLFSLILGLVGIIWILLSTDEQKPSAQEKAPLVQAKPKPELKPITRKQDTSVGIVSISTVPKAIIMHKDLVLGNANAAGRAGPFEIPEGRARLRASFSERGFERSLTVYIKGGQKQDINMVARKGKLLLKTNEGATVELNGKLHESSQDSLVLDEGTHHLLIQHQKLRKRYESMIRLSPGEQKLLDIDLVRVGEDL